MRRFVLSRLKMENYDMQAPGGSPVQSFGLDNRNSPTGRVTHRGLLMSRLAMWAFLLAACTDSGATGETLRSAGYTKVATTGWSCGTCGDKDWSCTGFEATGPTGVRVTGAVGCGFWFKGCTIRTTGTAQ
jgi:hypothetical protein